MSLVHVITGENSRLRRWGLYLFARYLEMPLLYFGYHLLRGRYRRLGANRLVRAVMSWGVVAPFGYAGDTARPRPASEVLHLIEVQEGPIAVGPCRCRTAHRACDHPLETDIVIRTGVEAWTRAFPHEYRQISKAEAKEIVSHCSRLGMWPMVFVHCPVHEHRHAPGGTHVSSLGDGQPRPSPVSLSNLPSGVGGGEVRGENPSNEYVICNCCTCGCVPFILNRDLGQKVYPLLRGAYVAVTDLACCNGHGGCVTACPFGVRTLVGGKAQLVESCFGCGVCIAACPEGAIVMRRA